jgi:hypothetical protein
MEQIQVVVPTDGSPLSIPEILYTVEYLRGAYIVAGRHLLRNCSSLEPDVPYTVIADLAVDLSSKMEQRYPNQAELIDFLTLEGRKELPSEFAWADITLVNIARKNPIELMLLGFSAPLAIAMILSGGKFQLGPLKVELPPLGKGILELRKALQPLPSKKVKEIALAGNRTQSAVFTSHRNGNS